MINELKMNREEKLRMKISMDTSMGVLTTKWIDVKTNENRLEICDNVHNNLLKLDYSQKIDNFIIPSVAALLSVTIILSPLMTLEQAMDSSALLFVVVLVFGYFSFNNGVKNSQQATGISFILSVLLVAPIIIASGSFEYVVLSLWYFVMILYETMICSGTISGN